jgi:sulfur carrier protein ThiS
MRVSVHLHTILQKQTDHGLVDRLEVELPVGSRVADLLGKLEIEIHPDSLLLAVNGRVAEPERFLEDGDEVNLMPAISGGCSNGVGSVWAGKADGQLESGSGPHHMGLHWMDKEVIACELWY